MKRFFLFLIFSLTLFGNVYAEEATKKIFTLTTEDFLDQGILPVLYTCDGKDISPQLSWTDAPANTKSFVLLMTDQTIKKAEEFYHWVVFNIPGKETSLAEGIKKLPAGTISGKNNMGKTQYSGPCPPKGTSHTYVITLYALDQPLKLDKEVDGKEVAEAVKNNLGKATLTFVYSRWLE